MAKIGFTYWEASERTGISVDALRMRVKRKKICFTRAGKKVLLHPADVEALTPVWEGKHVKGAKVEGKDS